MGWFSTFCLHKRSSIAVAICVTTIAIQIAAASVGWWNRITDFHDWRQTQTAISARSLLEGAPILRYETPVLGKPWAIPQEFPLYHAFVAAIVEVIGIPLDQAGRLVSVVSFDLLLLTTYLGLRTSLPDRYERLLIVSLVAASPLYLFWSRTFMIELTAVLFAVGFVAAYCASKPVASAVLGTAAALAKVTTFMIVAIPLVALIIVKRRTWLSVIAVPFVVGGVWVVYAESVLKKNPFASMGALGLAGYVRTQYATLVQGGSAAAWIHMFRRSLPEIAGKPGFLVVLGAGAYAILRPSELRYPALFAALMFLLGPLLLRHQYEVHNYYFCANAVWLLLFGGLGIVALTRRWPSAVILVPLVVTSMYVTYSRGYFRKQLIAFNDLLPMAQALESHTPANAIVLIYGHMQNPTVPYYAHRKAIMDTLSLPLTDTAWRREFQILRSEKIEAMICNACTPQFIQERLAALDLEQTCVFRGIGGELYVSRDSGGHDGFSVRN